MVNVLLCKEFELAKEKAKEIGNVGAIECEYGDNTITEDMEGVSLSFYHHGEYADNKPPCLRWDVYDTLEKPLDNFIISHIDIDTVFGIMWASKILRPTDIAKEIAELVALQDINGFHYMEAKIIHNLPDYLKYRFLGIGYTLSRFKFDDSEGNCIDFSRAVHKMILKFKDIIVDGITDELKEVIDTWLIEKEKKTLVLIQDYQENFFNYFIKSGSINPLSAYKLSIHPEYAKINIVYNSESGLLTLAAFNEEWAKKIFKENGVITPLQKYFGDAAGGRISVGGSPRSKFISKEEADGFVKWLKRSYFNSKILKRSNAKEKKLIKKTPI